MMHLIRLFKSLDEVISWSEAGILVGRQRGCTSADR